MEFGILGRDLTFIKMLLEILIGPEWSFRQHRKWAQKGELE
jgi:hypothetical protein